MAFIVLIAKNKNSNTLSGPLLQMIIRVFAWTTPAYYGLVRLVVFQKLILTADLSKVTLLQAKMMRPMTDAFFHLTKSQLIKTGFGWAHLKVLSRSIENKNLYSNYL